MFKTADRAPVAAMTTGRRKDRATDELIGICRGVLADGSANINEARFLLDWIDRHVEFVDQEPFRSIYARLADALEDGVLDATEEAALIDVLHATIGGEADGLGGVTSRSTSLPLCNPAPTVLFEGSVFVATGTFTFGSRREVFGAIESRGGIASNTVNKKTRYLVIGDLGSRDWMHSSFGRKIEEAMELRSAGLPLSIIDEQHWQRHLL